MAEVIVKYGYSTTEREGQTLLYLESEVPDIPAPRLYAMYYDSRQLFLVMQRKPGVRLDYIWPNLTEEEKTSLTTQLRKVMDSLRAATCPQPCFFGSVDGGPVPHHLFYSEDKNHQISGPFDSEEAFNMGLVLRYKEIRDINEDPDFKARFYAKNLGKVLCGHRSTLTHSDIQLKNIVVLVKGPDRGEQGRVFEIALVDWEDAGWYPDYWEYFTQLVSMRWDEDWSDRVEEFIPSWPAQAAMMKMIHSDLFF
ncbi:hypothetical protein B0A50_06314 [Salinomyces thailandicus]|uniref:Aminoglycoside phosphotransferase domain-containing protein n=1 Tax=Salinomyces thailandicus TaxID=706561 RepID=A0A4U0TTH4_9PEZI|nr:hypothetical protein B0A50_06314 [Salinomyces thailandica]